MTRPRFAQKPRNFDALVDAVIREDRDAWRTERDLYRLQVQADGEDW